MRLKIIRGIVELLNPDFFFERYGYQYDQERYKSTFGVICKLQGIDIDSKQGRKDLRKVCIGASMLEKFDDDSLFLIYNSAMRNYSKQR
jgi:hypothetical protein